MSRGINRDQNQVLGRNYLFYTIKFLRSYFSDLNMTNMQVVLDLRFWLDPPMHLQISQIGVELLEFPLAQLSIFVDVVNLKHQFCLLLGQFKVGGEHSNGVLLFESHDKIVTIFVEYFLCLWPAK